MTRDIFAVDPMCAGRRLSGVEPFDEINWGVLVVVRAECRSRGPDRGPGRRDPRPVRLRIKGDVKVANFQAPKGVLLCQRGTDQAVQVHRFTGGSGYIFDRDWTRSGPWTLTANGTRIAAGRATIVTRLLGDEPSGFLDEFRTSYWTT